MEIVRLGPLPSAFLLWQSRPNAWGLTLVCKATFHLQPGEAALTTEQLPIYERDQHWDGNTSRSVHAPCDVVPFKPCADILLVGSAFAPNQTPVQSLVASLTFGEMTKSVEIHCDRAMMMDGSIQEGSGFVQMPLVYELTAGGPGHWNPVGMRTDARDTYGRIILPNIQKPGARPSPSMPLEPTGFGPLAPLWSARAEKLGQATSPYAFREKPLPKGMDPGHFNAAPPDQQLPTLREGEWLILENLHPDLPKLRTAVPSIRPAVFLKSNEKAPQRVQMRMDTLWIDTDQKIFTVTWRGQLALSRRDEWTAAISALETANKAITWPEIEAHLAQLPASRATIPDDDAPESLTPISVEDVVMTKPPPTAARPNEDMTAFALPFPSKSREGVIADDHTDDGRRDTIDALPFAAIQSMSARPPISGASSPSPVTALPFAPKPAAPAAPITPPAPIAPMAPPIAPPAPVAPPSAVASPIPIPSPVAPSIASKASIAPVVPMAPASSPGWASGPPPSDSSPSITPAPSPSFSGSGGAVAASNAAAAAQASWSISTSPSPLPVSTPLPSAARFSARMETPDVNQLIWYHDPSVARFRRAPEWKPLLKELERKPRDKDLDDPALAPDPMQMEERREVFEILTLAPAKSFEAVQQAYFDAIREDGKFVPPLILVAGELMLPFDELETLKATITTVSPLVTPTDENLRTSIDNAKEFLKTPGLTSAPAVSEGLTVRIKEAFAQGRRGVPPAYVDTQTERVLLEQRSYQRRAVLGEKHLRGLLTISGSQTPVPTYIPEEVCLKLPMYQRFRVRIVAEVHQQEDQHESHSLSLRVLALSRVTPPPRR
ncbi:MAG: DUF2169 domain-containing protein [Polyangiaceae bacterium]|nr:DUF2169 domain-containing protein [Polyangiaceae bacterium]